MSACPCQVWHRLSVNRGLLPPLTISRCGISPVLRKVSVKPGGAQAGFSVSFKHIGYCDESEDKTSLVMACVFARARE